jgi:hypothetical protein
MAFGAPQVFDFLLSARTAMPRSNNKARIWLMMPVR